MSSVLLEKELLSELQQRLGRDRLIQILNAQLRFGGENLNTIDRLRETLDRREICSISHQLAGTSGSLGLMKLGMLAGQLEREGDTLSDESLLAALDQIRAVLISSLEALSETYPDAHA